MGHVRSETHGAGSFTAVTFKTKVLSPVSSLENQLVFFIVTMSTVHTVVIATEDLRASDVC